MSLSSHVDGTEEKNTGHSRTRLKEAQRAPGCQ